MQTLCATLGRDLDPQNPSELWIDGRLDLWITVSWVGKSRWCQSSQRKHGCWRVKGGWVWGELCSLIFKWGWNLICRYTCLKNSPRNLSTWWLVCTDSWLIFVSPCTQHPNLIKNGPLGMMHHTDWIYKTLCVYTLVCCPYLLDFSWIPECSNVLDGGRWISCFGWVPLAETDLFF